MLTETAVSAILTASVTGAGLIIAIYALITPIARRIFEERVEFYRKKKEEFDKLKETMSSESSDRDFKQFKTLAKEIRGIKIFPRYLSVGVFIVFACYTLTIAFAFGCLTSPSARIFGSEVMVQIFFAISTIGFFFVGSYSIMDVHRAMKAEFEQVKKDKEEVEKTMKVKSARELIDQFLEDPL